MFTFKDRAWRLGVLCFVIASASYGVWTLSRDSGIVFSPRPLFHNEFKSHPDRGGPPQWYLSKPFADSAGRFAIVDERLNIILIGLCPRPFTVNATEKMAFVTTECEGKQVLVNVSPETNAVWIIESNGSVKRHESRPGVVSEFVRHWNHRDIDSLELVARNIVGDLDRQGMPAQAGRE